MTNQQDLTQDQIADGEAQAVALMAQIDHDLEMFKKNVGSKLEELSNDVDRQEKDFKKAESEITKNFKEAMGDF